MVFLSSSIAEPTLVQKWAEFWSGSEISNRISHILSHFRGHSVLKAVERRQFHWTERQPRRVFIGREGFYAEAPLPYVVSIHTTVQVLNKWRYNSTGEWELGLWIPFNKLVYWLDCRGKTSRRSNNQLYKCCTSNPDLCIFNSTFEYYSN